MAKNKNIIIALLCLLNTFCVSGQSTIRKAIIDTALSQVGVRELTGNNDGKAVEKYLKVCKLGKGYAWCAAFCAWNYKVNGVITLTSAWAPSWFPAKKTIYIRDKLFIQTPQTADMFGIYFNNRIAHVGLVYVWGDKIVKTIEGNTNEAGSREGDGVYIKRRLKKQIYAVSKWANE